MKQSVPRRRVRSTAPAREAASLPSRTLLSTAIATACGLGPGAAVANTITPDGRTDTSVTVEGARTDIATNTVRGGNAFNSFREFRISAGNTVNLQLPDATDNLINLVTDSRAVVNGTLNSVRDGRIGGNVVFADPKGIVVGNTGTMNVGSLMLTTPTAAFMDRMMDASGVIDDAAVRQLLAGDAPQSTAPDAAVEVDGAINAFGAVTLQGGGVALQGEIEAGTDAAHEELYQASVNTDGIEAASDAEVVDGRVTIRAAGDVTVAGSADASSAQAKTSGTATRESGGSAGRVEVTAGGNVDLAQGSRLAAVGAADGGDGGRVDVRADGNITASGEIDASATKDASGGGTGAGGEVTVTAAQQLDVEASARVAAAGAAAGGDGGRIELGADGTANVSGSAELDASAGASGDGGEIELDGAGDLSLAGLDADLAGGTGGADGQLLISTVNVSVSGTEYYTNGGDVTINAGDTLTIASGTTINTRRTDDSRDAVEITPASDATDNPAGLANPTNADDYTVASEGDSGNVLLQAPRIAVADGARIYTFATDGYDGGDVSLVSGDNFTCNICEARDPTDYFSSVEDIGNSLRVASTDDVSIDIADGATIDARYVERSGYSGPAGTGGDVELAADASDLQVAGWSMADASVTVNGALRGANVDVSATADAGVDFAWLAGLDPANPASGFGALQEISTTEFDQIHQNTIENADDPSDLTNLLGIGLPVTAGIAMADATVTIGSGAELTAAENVTVRARANRTVKGASGGLLNGSLPALGIGVIYGQVSGTTTAEIAGDAVINAASLDVTAESNNQMSVAASAQVTSSSSRRTRGNQSAAFSLGIGRADVTTEARVGDGVTIDPAAAGGTVDIAVRAGNLDAFNTEASAVALTDPRRPSNKPQGAVTVAFSEWRSEARATFDADVAAAGSLDVVADNLSEERVTKATVQNGNNFFDYALGGRRGRSSALRGLILGAYSRGGSAASFRLAGAAGITVSDQTAVARIGEATTIDAAGDVTVRSRVVDQGIRSVADSRVNSTGGGDSAGLSGSVAIAFGLYDHTSHAVIGDGADISAERIGVGSRATLPIDDDYDDVLEDYQFADWEGPENFFRALNTTVSAVLAPDVPALESFGLADYLLTSYANAYGTAEDTAIFGSANATIATQDTRAWVGEGAQLTARGADGEWTSDFGFEFEPLPGNDSHDLDVPEEWTWSGAVDVDARTTTETAGVVGNLSLLTLIMNRNAPAGTSVGGSFGWTEFDNTTIAGIGDGAVIDAASLDVQATTDERMIVVAPSAGVGESTAGNGIFSLAQVDGTTHASIHEGARVEADTVDIIADYGMDLWAIGGAVAVSDENSIGAAVAVNSVESDTRAYIGDNSDDRVLDAHEDAGDPAPDVTVADGSAAGVRTGALNVDAKSRGAVGAIGVAGAVSRSSPAPGSPSAPPGPPPPGRPGNNSFVSAIQTAGDALGGGGSAPGGATPTLSGSGSGTLNFSRIDTVAEVDGATLLHADGDPSADLSARALSQIDQVSASGSAAVSISGGAGGRSSAFAGAVAFNDIDNTTRAGLYGVAAPNGGRIGDLDVLAASAGDAMSVGVALAAASGQSSIGAAISASIATIDADTTAEIEDSELQSDGSGEDATVNAYDGSRMLVGGGSLNIGTGGGSGAGVGLAATYGRIDNDVTAYLRGTTLNGFDTLDVSALGAARILAGAFGGSVSSGNKASGAGSLYIMTIDSDLSAGITGLYGTTSDGDGNTVTDYDDLQQRSDVDTAGDVTVNAASSGGVPSITDLFDADGGLDDQADFGGDALGQIDPEETGLSPSLDNAGEAVLGFAGSLAISGGNASAGFAIGFTDLQGGYTAEIRDADVTADAGDVDVKAINARRAIGVAAGASVSGSGGPFTALGSGAITLSSTEVTAQVLGDSTIAADHVDIAAAAEGNIFSLAGSLSASASGSAAVGAAATYNRIGGSVTARLGGDSVVTDGSDPADDEATVDVTANQDADIQSLAIAASATGGSAAIGGSATINTITTETRARLDADGVTADTVRVQVTNGTIDDRVGVMSLAGSITASSSAGFGAAFAVNTLSGTYDARVDGTTFTDTEALEVEAASASEVKTLAVSGGASGGISAGVSDATSSGDYDIDASLNNAELDNAGARVTVGAADDSTIDSLAGAIQIGSSGAVGAAIAVNSLSATTDAGISGGRLDVENVLLQARSRADIDTSAIGIAGSGDVAISGSVAVNRIGSATRAVIDGGATVLAANNVGVLAGSDDSVSIGAGAVGISGNVAGGAGSVTVNLLEGETEAAIKGASTRVEARGEDDGDTIDASGGELDTTPSGNPFASLFDIDPESDIGTPDEDAFSGYTAPGLGAASTGETGVVVDAIALQEASTVSASVGGSAGVGVATVVNTTVLGGSARALVEDATIGDSGAADANGDLTVAAGHHAHGTNILLGAGVGGTGGVAGIGVDTFSGEATAAIRGADVYAGGDVDLDATSRRDLLSVLVGVAVGASTGISGSGAVSVFNGATTAGITGDAHVEANSADLQADSDTEKDLFTIGVAGSAGGAGSGVVNVAVSQSDTTARIGDGTDRTEVYTDDRIDLDALNTTRVNTIGVSAAAGGGAVSGSVGVQYIGNTTYAGIHNARADAGGTLDVHADEDLTLDAIAGSAAVGGGAGGIGVNVGVVKSDITAEIRDSHATSGGALTVEAERDVNIEVDTVVAAGGAGGAISGGVGVLLFGDALAEDVHEDTDGDLGDELGDENGEGSDGDWLDRADAFRGEEPLAGEDDDGNTVDRSQGGLDRVASGSAGSGDDDFSGVRSSVYGEGVDGVKAEIVGGTVEAGEYTRTAGGRTLEAGDRPVTVKSTDRLRTRNEVIAVSIGGAVSAGGGVAVTQVNTNVGAQASADTLKASSLEVKATATNGTDDDGDAADALRTAGYAAAGGGFLGIGAAVAVGTLNGTVDATAGGDIDLRDGAEIVALDETTADVQSLGASFALSGAVGVSVSVADRNATVGARLADNADLRIVGDDPATERELEVRADAKGGAESDAEAAAGGLLASGNSAVAVSTDDRTVTADIGRNAYVASNGDVTVRARALADVGSRSDGGSIAGGVSVGASIASSTSNIDLDAGIKSGTAVVIGGDTAGTLTVSAEQHAPDSAGDWADGYDGAGVRAYSRTINGAGLLAANGSDATATDRGSVDTDIADGVDVVIGAAGSAIDIDAYRESALLAESSGIVAGAAAIGASLATADSDASTSAYFGGATTTLEGYFGSGPNYRVARFDLDADSVTDVVSDATSGSGGIIAGAGAEAESIDDADTTAEIGGAAVVVGEDVAIDAHHLSRFRPASDSTQAAAVGYSGSFADADIDSTVKTIVADASDASADRYAFIQGYDVALTSDSDVEQGTRIDAAPGRTYSVEGGAGGVLNGASADSDIDIDKTSAVEIGTSAFLGAVNRPDATASSGLATLALLATGSVTVRDNAYLGAGGGIQAPYASSFIDLDGDNDVVVGDNVRLLSEDLLGLSAYEGPVIAEANAVTKTWGGVGFAGANTENATTYNQTVEVGADALVEGLGFTYLTAGRRADAISTQAETIFEVNSLSETYNYTAVPLDTSIDVNADLSSNSEVIVGSGTDIVAGWDVIIGAVEGESTVVGEGTGHNPYLEILSQETTERNESTSGLQALRIDGTVTAGFFNEWSFDVADSGDAVTVRLNGQALDDTRAAQDRDAYVSLLGGFDPKDYVDGLFDDLDGTVREFADQVDTGGLPGSVDLVRVHDVTATQGNVLVHGDSMTGSGTVEARGGASIAVTNGSEAWLDVSNLNVVDNGGGRVLFNGAIDPAQGNVTVNEVKPDVSATVAVIASGDTGAGSAAGQPGLIISGPIRNQLGRVRLYNRQGNIYQGSVVQANAVEVVAPNGTYVVIAPDRTIRAGGTPWSAWAGAEFGIGARDIIAYSLRDAIGSFRSDDEIRTDFDGDGDIETVTLGEINAWDTDGDPDTTYLRAEQAFNKYLYQKWDDDLSTEVEVYDGDGNLDYTYIENYDRSFIPYNDGGPGGSATGSAGSRPYVYFDKEFRQARFDIVPLKAMEQTQGYSGIDDSGAEASGIRSNKVLILADVLDINAPIVAGKTSDITIELDQAIKDRVDAAGNRRVDLTWYHETGLYQDLKPEFRELLGLPDIDDAAGEGWYALEPGQAIPFTADRTVSGYYDPGRDAIVMNGIQGANTGYISVDAKIVSTTQLGRLEVVNGYSDIRLENTTGYDFVLNEVSTGTAETGVIEITDRLRGQRTWFVNETGGATRRYVTTDLDIGTWRDPALSASTSGTDTYSPLAGARQWWERRYRAKRELNTTKNDADNDVIDYFNGTVEPWEFADGDWKTGTTGVFDGTIVDSAICTSGCAYGGNADFHQEVTRTSWSDELGTRYKFTFDESIDGFSNDDASGDGVGDINGDELDYHSMRWPRRAEMRTRTSVRADYAIDIAFSGDNTGEIDIDSDADVTLQGRLDSVGGGIGIRADNAVDDASISALDSALLKSDSFIGLNADGDIGAPGAPIRVSHEADGTLLGISRQGDVRIDSPAGGLNLFLAAADGAVELSAAKSIRSYPDGGFLTPRQAIAADTVRLEARGGGIGAIGGGALTMTATGRVDASAIDGIHLRQVAPLDDADEPIATDLRLGSVVSAAGDVTIENPEGSILSATNLTGADLVPLDELRTRWAELGLTGAAAEADADRAIETFERSVERNYALYWQYAREITTDADGNLAVTEQGRRLYAGLAAAADTETPVTASEYVISEFQRLGERLREALAVDDLSTVAGFDRYDADWSYQAPTERAAEFRVGAAWRERQLENAVNGAAVSGGGAGAAWLGDRLNVVGNNITLDAGAHIGSSGNDAFTLVPETTITDRQRRLLLTAAPGGLSVTEAAGGAVDIEVRTLGRLRVETRGQLDIAAGLSTDVDRGDVYVGADGTATVQRLSADGEVYLGAEEGIRSGSPLVGAAGGMTLRAVTGDILGIGGGALDLAIDGTLTAAIGAGVVSLRDVGGAAGLDVGILNAQDRLAVRVPGDLRQVQGRGFTIGGRSLALDIGGDAGAAGDGTTGFAGPLDLRMRGLGSEPEPGLDGTVFGTVGGDLYLAGDAAGLRLSGAPAATAGAAAIGRDLGVGGDLVLTSAGDVFVDGLVEAAGTANLQSTADLRFGGGILETGLDLSLIADALDMTSGSRVTALGGAINAGVNGDARLGLLEGAASDADTTAPAIAVSAGRSILSARGPAEANLRATDPAGFSLLAGSDIGAADHALVLAGTGPLDASAGHDVYLRLLDNITGGDLTATDGGVTARADGGLTLDSITALGAIDLAAATRLAVDTLDSSEAGLLARTNGPLTVGTANTELAQDWQAGGDFTADELVSRAADVRVRSLGAIDVGTASAAIDLTLDAAGALAIDTAEVERDLRLDTGAELTLEAIAASRDITIESAGGTTGGPIEAGRDLAVAAGYDEGEPVGVADLVLHAATGGTVDLRATGDIRVRGRDGYAEPAGRVDAAGDATLTAGGDIDAGTVDSAGGAINGIAAGAIDLGTARSEADQAWRAGADFSADRLVSRAGNVGVVANGAIDVGTATAAVDATLDATGALAIGEVTVGRDLRLDTGAGLSLDGLAAGRDITTESIDDTSGGSIEAGRDLTVAAGYDEGARTEAISDILLHSVAGETVDLRATGAIRILDRAGYTDPGGLVAADRDAVFTAGGDVEATRVRVGGDARATGGTITFDDVEAGFDVVLDAGDDIVVFEVASGGDQDLRAGGAIDFDRLAAGGSIDSTSRGDTIGREAVAGGDATLVAGVEPDAADPRTAPIVATSDLRVESVTGTAVWLRAGGENLIETIGARTTAKLEGRAIDARVRDVDGGRLDMAFSSGDGGLADTVRLDVISDGLVAFDPAYARDARIDTTSERIFVADGWITDWFSLDTPAARVVMDQLDPTARNVDFQLRELDERFALDLEGRVLRTDAYIQRYRGGYANAVPNFVRDHENRPLDVGGESAERKITRSLNDEPEASALGGRVNRPLPPRVPIGAPADGAPVNLGPRRRPGPGSGPGI